MEEGAGGEGRTTAGTRIIQKAVEGKTFYDISWDVKVMADLARI